MKYICSGCGEIVEPDNGKLPEKCPNCRKKFEDKQWLCLGECKGETTIIETSGSYLNVHEHCMECFSDEIFEVEKPVQFTVPA